MTNKEFTDWCFNNLEGNEDKYTLGLKVWLFLTKENLKLARKLARLEKELDKQKDLNND